MTTQIEQDDEATRLKADIARTRRRLATSVDALTARLDVPGRVQHAAARRVEPVRRLAGGVVTLATTVTGVAWTVTQELTRDGIGIGVAVARWGAGSAVRAFTRGR